MTLPPDEVRLLHIRDAEAARDFIAERTRADLDADHMLRLALTKLVEIIGESAKQMSEPTRTRFPQVAWADAARMRDRLVHHYFDIDLDVLWATVKEDLPDLLAGLESSP